MRCSFPLIAAFLVASLSAQTASSTLPKGWDSTEGVEVGTATNTMSWGGFDIEAPVTTGTRTYNPARVMYLYDSSEFPWDPKIGTVITKLSFRRDGLYSRGTSTTTTAHTKDWAIIMSTSTQVPAQCNFNLFEDNHGTNRTEVFGKVGTPKTVTFLATPQPTTGTAPFDVVVSLSPPMIVPANAKTIVIEIRSYKASVTSGFWRVDAVGYSGANYNGGIYTSTNNDHCVSPSILFTDRPLMIGSNFGHIWRSQLSPGGRPVLTWLGPQNNTPFPYPGTQCSVHVFPVLLLKTSTSETSGQFSVYVDWGKLPILPPLVGQSIGHQSMFVDSQYAGGVGLTRGAVQQVGSGYDPTLVKSTQLYSFGNLNNARYIPVMDPDKEPHPRWFFRRAPVIKIN